MAIGWQSPETGSSDVKRIRNLQSRLTDLAMRPQIIRNAPLLTIYLEASTALNECIPAPLAIARKARLVLNMWFKPSAEEITNFGSPEPMGVTYFAAEVDGEEGASSDGKTHFPGRFWLEHWSSSPAARGYAYGASGLKIDAGETNLVVHEGRATATLKLGDRTVIRATANIQPRLLATGSGHSIYYAQRSSLDESESVEVARFEIPWVSDSHAASEATVDLSFPDAHPALRFLQNGEQRVTDVTFRRMTLVPYLAQGRLLPAEHD